MGWEGALEHGYSLSNLLDTAVKPLHHPRLGRFMRRLGPSPAWFLA